MIYQILSSLFPLNEKKEGIFGTVLFCYILLYQLIEEYFSLGHPV